MMPVYRSKQWLSKAPASKSSAKNCGTPGWTPARTLKQPDHSTTDAIERDTTTMSRRHREVSELFQSGLSLHRIRLTTKASSTRCRLVATSAWRRRAGTAAMKSGRLSSRTARKNDRDYREYQRPSSKLLLSRTMNLHGKLRIGCTNHPLALGLTNATVATGSGG